MTSSPVNVSSYYAGPMTAAKGAEQAKKGGDFSEIFKNVQDTDSVKEPEVTKPEEVEKAADEVQQATDTTKAKDTSKAAEAEEAKETTVEEAEKPEEVTEEAETEEISEEVHAQIMELLKTVVSDVKELIAVTLDIPKDEVEAVMDAMQLSDADLLNPETVSKVCNELLGVEDMMALITDEELLNQVKTVETGFAELMKGLEDEVESTTGLEVEDVLQQLKQMMKEETPETKMPTITVENESDFKPEMTVARPEDAQNTSKESKNGGEQQMQFAGQNILNGSNSQTLTVNAGQQTVGSTMSYAQMADIMNQVMDYMNVQIGLEETTLHMQLHPEELGTVQVHISAKEGVMTAHFTTETEAVKTVLENQMVQLQEKFDAQNIKVDAIEISVEAHGFEENLQKGQAQDREQSQAKKKGTRRIDLAAMDSVTSLPEDERLAAEMMQANGGTVDYMV